MKSLFFTFLLTISALTGASSLARDADCSVARDPRRCEAKQTAKEACAGLQGQARSACINAAMPPPDCGKAPNTAECLARQSAAAACKDQKGKAHRQCLREHKSRS